MLRIYESYGVLQTCITEDHILQIPHVQSRHCIVAANSIIYSAPAACSHNSQATLDEHWRHTCIKTFVILLVIVWAGDRWYLLKFKLTILMQRYWHILCHYYVIIYDNITTSLHNVIFFTTSLHNVIFPPHAYHNKYTCGGKDDVM